MGETKTITALQPQRRKEDRLNLYLDGEFAFSLHASVAAGLQVGQALSPEAAERLQHQDAVHKACERALRLLSYRPRSRAELAQRLRSKGIAESIYQEALDKLEDAGWIDDAVFARFWVEEREYFRPRSQRALRTELRRKGVSDSLIEESLQEINEQESAYQAAFGRAQRWARLDYQTFRRRLGGFLQRRGFDYGIVKETVERLWKECAGEQADACASSANLGPSAQDEI